MAYRLEFRLEASADVAEAFSWYEERRRGLGAEFADALDSTIQLITAFPAAGPVVYRGLRRALVRRFPFAVYYVLEGEQIVVRGVLHMSRHPRVWQRRA